MYVFDNYKFGYECFGVGYQRLSNNSVIQMGPNLTGYKSTLELVCLFNSLLKNYKNNGTNGGSQCNAVFSASHPRI